MVLSQSDLITVNGLPAHPLLVHAVVVLLPLAAVGGLVIALRPSWRRRFGIVVLAMAAGGIAPIPFVEESGEQLEEVLTPNPLIEEHADLGNAVLPFALAFGVAVVLLLVAGRLADREREAASTAEEGAQITNLWRRLAIVAAALVAFTGVASTVQVVRAGDSGAKAVWEGIG